MKNSNLLNRLLSYSHEKQSPQRFARYAAMLMMLLILGVGQMWAGSKTFYLKPSSDWKSNSAWFAICYGYDNSDDQNWVKMNPVTGTDWYSADVPDAASSKNLIFCRMNPSAQTLAWSQKWNNSSWVAYSAGDHYVVEGGSTYSWFAVGFELKDGDYYNNGIKYYDGGNREMRLSTSVTSPQSQNVNSLNPVTTLYLKEWFAQMYENKDFYARNTVFKYNVHRTAASAGEYTTDSHNWEVSGNWSGGYLRPKIGHSDHEENSIAGLNVNLLSGLGSGLYTMSYYFYDGDLALTSPVHSLNWKIGVPAISSPTCTSDGTGAGTSESPFMVAVGEDLTLTVGGSQASSDANSALWAKFASNSYSSTLTYKIENLDATKRSISVKAKYYNSADDLSGTEQSWTIYYQGSATPSLAISSFTQDASTVTAANSGSTVTINASRQNAGTETITYAYSTDNSNWTTIASTSSTSQSWTIPACTSTTTYYVKASMTYDETPYSDTETITVYGKKVIKVKDTNSWGANFYLRIWGGVSNEYPGSTDNTSAYGTGQWKQVVLYSSSTNFLLAKGPDTSTADANKTADQTYAGVTDGSCYQIQSGSGGSLTLTSTDCPEAPSVTTAAATSVGTTSVQFNASSVSANNDAITDYGFKWGTTSACSDGTVTASNLGAGTTFSATKSSLTNGTTYYFKAYATNGQGTTYGSAVSVRTKYITTVTLDQEGGSDGTEEVTATEGSAMPSGATAPGKSGYTFGGYYASAGGSGTQYYNSSMGSAHNWDVAASTATIHAKWTPITYTIRFNGNGSTSGSMSNQTGIAYDAATTITANAFVKTGYNFAGWALSSGGAVVRANEEAHGNLSSINGATVDLYAKWTAKQSTLSFDYQDEAEGYGADGSVTAASKATYDATMPALSGSLPTAATGYAFMGFYDATGGGGTKYYNADGSSARNWDKDTESGTTLYAYYKKAEITEITLSDAIVAPNTSITATPTISPTPTGTTGVCWELRYSNGTRVPSQPTFTPEEGNAVSFNAPAASATYILQAKLRLDNCDGDVLSTQTTTFQVAGEHKVTIEYKCGDDVIKASTELEGIKALDWSDDITKTDIFGYRFVRWDAGDGVSIKDGGSSTTTSTSTTIKIKAIYDGKLTAVYAANDYIYFKNTLGWSADAIYVYFYNSSGYWNETYGSGSYGCLGHGKMLPVEGETDIYYWDYGANITEGAAAATQYVSFTWGEQANEPNFRNIDVVYPTKGGNAGFKTGTPMFVPHSKSVQDPVFYNKVDGKDAPYYNKGYWTKYKGGTGYWVDIFYSKGGGDDWDKSVGFVEGESAGMPYTSTVNLTGGSTLGFKIGRKGAAGGGSDVYYYATTDVTMANAATAKALTNGNNRTGITTNVAGDYVFTLTCASDGALNISVAYPAAANDYRVVYSDLAAWSGASAHNANWYHPSATVGRNTSATEPKTDIVSFYVSKADGASASMKFQYISSIDNTSVTWSDVDGGSISLSDITKSGVYNFYLSQPAGGASITVDSIRPYTGSYYIRSTMANSKWDNYSSDPNHIVYHSDYAEAERGFTHYWVKYVSNGSDIRYVIANDYSPCISDTLVADVESSPVTTTGGSLSTSEEGVNIRSMWDYRTNKLSRAYLTGPVSNQYLLLRSLYQSTASNNRVFKSWTSAESNTRLNHASFTESAVSYDLDTLLFKDNQNWMYQLDIYARPAATYKLSALVNGTTTFIRGLEGNYTTAANIDTLLGGNPAGTKAYHVRMVYDFKSDRMMKAWMPEGEISENIAINADIMLVREHQDAGEQISFGESGSLTKVKTVYGVMRFNRWTLNNKEKTGGHSVVADPKSAYERGLYWISFPFDVNLSDVFGFGSYGTDWIIMEYDGAARAREGYWSDSEGFWKYVMSPTGKVLKAGTGYVLALDLDRMKDDNTTFWANNIQQVELYFPSSENVDNIKETNVEIIVPEHECTINRHSQAEKDAGTDTDVNKNRTVVDSHWNIIGIPSYANYGTALKDGTGATITWHNPKTEDLPYLYEWNMVDNSYTPQTGTTYPFKSMHGYMVQYHGTLKWALASATQVSPIVARSTYAEKPESVEMRIELQQNEMKVDQTFVKLSDDENASANFAFDEDLSKEFNANKANIYTFIEGYIPAAGNTMPMSEQTTVIPVGVRIATNGEYTFSIPDGTEGIGVVLIDNIAGTRTNLGLMDYTVTLAQGQIDDRFLLEISPISQISTDIEAVTGDGLQVTGARKIMIDGLLYIVKDGVVYDAQGRRL